MRRRFHVDVEGARVESIAPGEEGFGKVIEHSVDVEVRDGFLDVRFEKVLEHPHIAGFVIRASHP